MEFRYCDQCLGIFVSKPRSEVGGRKKKGQCRYFKFEEGGRLVEWSREGPFTYDVFTEWGMTQFCGFSVYKVKTKGRGKCRRHMCVSQRVDRATK